MSDGGQNCTPARQMKRRCSCAAAELNLCSVVKVNAALTRGGVRRGRGAGGGLDWMVGGGGGGGQ